VAAPARAGECVGFNLQSPSGGALDAEAAGFESVVNATADAMEDAIAAPEHRALRIDASLHGQRIDKVLVSLAPEFSRNHLQGVLDKGRVWIDGKPAAAASKRVQAGQQVMLELLPTEESQAFVPQPMSLSILFEDDHLLVLNKPAGLVVHPAPGNWSGTLLNGLLAHHPGAARLPRGGIVHRLDKETSGLMMVGKSLQAVTALSRAVAAREVKRRYLAMAHGWPQADHFSVDSPIGRDSRVRVRMAVVPVAAGGRPARTDVQCLARVGPYCALSCSLHTGRTHQIRVHLMSLGHPLLADALYGGSPALGLQRQALHATELGLVHPFSGHTLKFRVAPPADFAAAWQQLTTEEI
jgi:23S rRNA pseudouridine1911/1915/1917 synthase